MGIKSIARRGFTGAAKHAPERVNRFAIKAVNRKRIANLEKLNTPTSIIFYVTSRCNLRCKHCFYWKELNQTPKEMTLDEIKKAASSLKHPAIFSLTGGEPTLRQDIVEISKAFCDYNRTPLINIATNASNPRIVKERVSNILEKCPSLPKLSVQISLDGLRETHDKIRGMSGSFDSVFKTIEFLKTIEDKRLYVSTNTVLSKFNKDELTELITHLNRFGIESKVQVARGINHGLYNLGKDVQSDFNPKDPHSVELSFEELERVYGDLSELNKKLKNRFWTNMQRLKFRYMLNMIKEKKPQFDRCFAGLVDAVVYSDGSVAHCEMTKPFANLKDYDYDFYRLWKSDPANRMRDRIKSCFCIHGCNMITSMNYDTETLIRLLGKQKNKCSAC